MPARPAPGSGPDWPRCPVPPTTVQPTTFRHHIFVGGYRAKSLRACSMVTARKSPRICPLFNRYLCRLHRAPEQSPRGAVQLGARWVRCQPSYRASIPDCQAPTSVASAGSPFADVSNAIDRSAANTVDLGKMAGGLAIGQPLTGLGTLQIVEPELATHLHAVFASNGATFAAMGRRATPSTSPLQHRHSDCAPRKPATAARLLFAILSQLPLMVKNGPARTNAIQQGLSLRVGQGGCRIPRGLNVPVAWLTEGK